VIINPENKVELVSTLSLSSDLQGQGLRVRGYRENGFPIGEAKVDPVTGAFGLTVLDATPGLSSLIVAFWTSAAPGGRRARRTQVNPGFAKKLPLLLSVDCQNACGPPLSLTLNWNGTTSDIDLHIIEPGAAREVSYVNKIGQYGELDYDDVDGFGPEHYYGHTVAPGVYGVKIHAYSMNSDSNVAWLLTAYSGGNFLWQQKGIFDGTSPYSQEIPFEVSPKECPVCPIEGSWKLYEDLLTTLNPSDVAIDPSCEMVGVADMIHFHCPAVGPGKEKVFCSGTKWSTVDCCDYDLFCWWWEKECATLSPEKQSQYFNPNYKVFDMIVNGSTEQLVAVIILFWQPTALELVQADRTGLLKPKWNTLLDKVKSGTFPRQDVIRYLLCVCVWEHSMAKALKNLIDGLNDVDTLCTFAGFCLTSGTATEDMNNFKNILASGLKSEYLSYVDLIYDYHSKRLLKESLRSTLLLI
jgi:hypothetical protein